MRLMNKKILSAIFAGTLLVGIAACSSDKNSDDKKSPDASTSQSSDASSNNTDHGDQSILLNSIVDGEKLVLDVKKEAHKDEFKDIQVEAIDPNEVAYTYTYSNQLDADQEQANINAKEPELANEISRMREEMNKIGIKDPVVSVRYLNADGAEIWSKKYTG